MSLSLKVRDFDKDHTFGEFASFNPTAITDHWAAYLTYQLAETGDNLPGKNLQPRIGKVDFRKHLKEVDFHNTEKVYIKTHLAETLEKTATNCSSIQIPVPGYYSLLSLFYVF